LSPLALAVAGFVALSAWVVGLYLLKERTTVRFVPFLRSYEGSGRGLRRERWARRLREPLSLLAQLLLFGALALALYQRAEEPTRRRLRAVIVDVSRTMGMPTSSAKGPERIDAAKERALQYIRQLGVGEEALLIEMGERPSLRAGPTTDTELLLRSVEQIRLLDTEANWGASFELAKAVANGRELDILLLTDKPSLASTHSGADVHAPSLGGGPWPANIRVDAFSARRYPLGAGQFEAVVVASSNAPEPVLVRARLFALDLASGQRTPLDLAEFVLEAGAERRFTFRKEAGAPRALECALERVDGARDALLRDNIGRALLPEERQLEILIVGKESLFLTAALFASARVRLTHVAAEQYPPRDARGGVRPFELTVFREDAPPRVALTGPAIYLGARGPGLPVAFGKPLKMLGFDESDRKSKLFRFFDPFDTQILSGYSLRPEANDQVLASSGGLPLVVRGERPEGRFVITGFAPEDSDMVLRPAFPLFVRGLLEELIGEDSHDLIVSRQVGEPFEVDLEQPGAGRLALKGPLLEPDQRTRELPKTGRSLELSLDRTGFYELTRAGQAPLYLAVNSAPVTSEPRSENQPPSKVAPEPPGARAPAWVGWVFALLGLALFEYHSYHRRWTV
jgi:Ca-activated chloride channel homolog